MYTLKVVRYQLPEEIHQGFSLYEGHSVHVGAEAARVEGGPLGTVTIAMDPGLHFYIMNERGDTVDRFRWDWLRGSPERTRRVVEAAERLGGAEGTVLQAENRHVYIGRHVRESGSIATSLNLSEGPGPALLDNYMTAQLAAALLSGPFAPDA